MMNNKKDGYWPEDPVLSFNEEEKKVITDNFTNIKTAATEFATNYILTTKTGDKAWNEWLATAKKMGVEKIEKAYNDAQKRYDSIK